MIIAIPTDHNHLDTTVCISFGRAPYFLIYNSSVDSYDFIENPARQSQGGAGVKAAQTLVDAHATVLITPRCGENAAEIFNAADVKIYRASGQSVAENITSFKNDQLKILEEIHAGFHGH